jgi:hypothetical protein
MAELTAASWTDVWEMPWARAVAGVVVLCILIAFGFYVVSRYRDYAAKDRRAPYFDDSNLQEMLRRGDISEAEFRTIHTKSHGVSVVTGDPKSLLAGPLSLSSPTAGRPAADSAVDASRDDEEEERPRSSLPPSTK